ncbi:unnamed protein product [Prunus armeniaca]
MNGIKRQLTAAYSPQQNGVAKRKNCIIMNMVRSMLALKKVPKRFWPEAVNWSNHILNKCPTLTAKNVTPEEAWSGKKNLMLATLEYLAAWHMLISKWRKAMDVEIDAIRRNNTWELIDLPVGGKTIEVKWIFKTKIKENGEIFKYKARLVAKGYSQKHDIYYTEVFAPVARHDIIRLAITLAAKND